MTRYQAHCQDCEFASVDPLYMVVAKRVLEHIDAKDHCVAVSIECEAGDHE